MDGVHCIWRARNIAIANNQKECNEYSKPREGETVRVQGQSSDSDSKRDCSVWALVTVLVDWSTCVPPSSEGVMTCCERHIEGSVLTASRGFFVGHLSRVYPVSNYFIPTDFYNTRVVSPPLVFYTRQCTGSTVPSSLASLLHVSAFLTSPLPHPNALGLGHWTMGTGHPLGYNCVSSYV